MSKRARQHKAAQRHARAVEGTDLAAIRVLSDAADAIVGRARLANAGGKTFAGARDLYETCGYKRELTCRDYRDRFKRNAVAARIVEAKPMDTWRGGFELVDEQDLSKTSPFEKAWDELNKRLKITTMMQRADVLAGIGRYAVILLGAPGKLEEPLDTGAGEIAYLSVFAEDDAPIKEFDTKIESPRFGRPVFYELKRTNPANRAGQANVGAARRVHFSRVIHVADGLLDDLVYGTPRMERVWNLLDDLEKVTGGGAEAFWMRANQGMHVNIDGALNPTADELAAMKEDVEKYRHRLERVIRTRGADIKTLGSDTADFKGPSSAIIDQISAGTGIPQRVLMGSEQGKLAAEQDSVKYYRMIESRRLDFAQAQVVDEFVAVMMALKMLPEPKEGQYEVRWSQMKVRDDDEKADLAQKWAMLNSTAGEVVVEPDEIREMILGLEPRGVREALPSRPSPAGPAANGPGGPTVASGKEVADWEEVHSAADRFRPRLQTAANVAFTAGKAILNIPALKVALRARSEQAVFVLVSEAIVTTSNTLLPKLEELIGRVVFASGAKAAKRLVKLRAAKDSRQLADITFKFDKTDPRAVEWVRTHAAETVTGISETTREQIRDLVENAFDEQFDVDELTTEISDLIGNTDRAENIARTETMRASNQGQVEAWAQAVDAGLLTGDERQEWIVTPDDRLCPICEPLDGETAPFGGTFDTELGPVDAPPAHPRCRCTIGLSV